MMFRRARRGTARACGALLMVCFLLAACQQDPYRLRQLEDGAAGGDGGWIDAQIPPDGQPPGDGAKDGSSVDLSHDACLAMPEVCNNADDNCNGKIDEGFDKQADPRYCEQCKGCMWLVQKEAYPDCAAGKCAIKNCKPGYVDLDKNVQNGCEYACEASGVEICDGLDNDCNGKVDDVPPLAQNICKDIGPCKGTKVVCKGAQGWLCDYGPDVELMPCTTDADCGAGFKCVGGVCPGIVVVDENKCDGKDGDCDGVADDPWANPALPSALGTPCESDPTKVGICRPKGEWACKADQSGAECKQTQPGQQPTDETCNGLDDDCDGKVDEEADDAAGKGVVDAMVHVKRTVGGKSYDFYIYAYEASRPDAGASSVGKSGARACSRKGVISWGSVTYAEAAAACKAGGKRLCTGGEWAVACQGTPAALYPYGATYKPASCNGVDKKSGKVLPTGSLAGCEGGETGLYDMSGNLREWTNDKRGTTSGTPQKSIYVVRGGAYHTPDPGLSCTFDLSQAVEDVVLPAIGFRCCSDTAP
jgi:hypothetical protein